MKTELRIANCELRIGKPKIRNPQSEIRNLQLASGITLIELVVASVLTLVVILAIGQVDVTRLFLSQQVRRTTGLQSQAGIALADITKSLTQADRVRLLDVSNGQSSNVQFRIPIGTDFDNKDNYRWAQYRLVGTKIYLFDAGNCTPTMSVKFLDVSGLTVTFKDETPGLPPPGGEPAVQDNNVLELTTSSTNAETGETVAYTGEVTIRAGAYTDLAASCPAGGPCDSGLGLAPAGVSEPPNAC